MTNSETENPKDNLTLQVETVVNIPASTTIVGDVRTSDQYEIHNHIQCNPIVSALSFSVGALFASLIKREKSTPFEPTDPTHIMQVQTNTIIKYSETFLNCSFLYRRSFKFY